jgi:hypothetical protein
MTAQNDTSTAQNDTSTAQKYAEPHVCNMPSSHRMKMCSRIVTDGHRYCWQHRRTVRGAMWTRMEELGI